MKSNGWLLPRSNTKKSFSIALATENGGAPRHKSFKARSRSISLFGSSLARGFKYHIPNDNNDLSGVECMYSESSNNISCETEPIKGTTKDKHSRTRRFREQLQLWSKHLFINNRDRIDKINNVDKADNTDKHINNEKNETEASVEIVGDARSPAFSDIINGYMSPALSEMFASDNEPHPNKSITIAFGDFKKKVSTCSTPYFSDTKLPAEPFSYKCCSSGNPSQSADGESSHTHDACSSTDNTLSPKKDADSSGNEIMLLLIDNVASAPLFEDGGEIIKKSAKETLIKIISDSDPVVYKDNNGKSFIAINVHSSLVSEL
ncbi:unnamed protein product [Ambrosiozyma monospora]|uniref:Unnamed protein product n=1 Tax=Ambrosiozyma monospora TaxID=43982 RepID=A0A9W6YVZ7_AMBMO|nr:unnamed protein product [Ambrosiozyma monospora]